MAISSRVAANWNLRRTLGSPRVTGHVVLGGNDDLLGFFLSYHCFEFISDIGLRFGDLG